MENRHRLSCKVGINPDGQEWGVFWRWLNEVAWDEEAAKLVGKRPIYFLAGDFRHYDMTIPRFLIDFLVEEIISWYRMQGGTEEESTIRRVLMEEIGSCTRINGKYVYRCRQGVPSGHFLTAIFNSLLNYIIVKFVVFKCCKIKQVTMTHEIFYKNFRVATYGDDQIVALSSLFSWFSQGVLQRGIKTLFGMSYTDQHKNEVNLEPFVEPSELRFLQRSFRVTPDGVFAPLKKEIIEEMVNWVRTGDLSPEDASVQNLETALLQWFHYGKEVFEEKKRIYMDAAFKKGLHMRDWSYTHLYDEWVKR
jgi:hypothetical protein